MIVYLANFRDSLADAQGMVSIAHSKDDLGAFVWHSSARSAIVESSFMKMFIAWEIFLEKTFIAYMLGTASMRGIAIQTYVTPLEYHHANNLLLGSQRFVDWSTPDTVRRFAKLYFLNGEPYESGLGSVHSDLTDLKTIRNAASHASSTTSAALDALASRKLQTAVSGCSSSSLLLAADPNAAAGQSFLNTYCQLLEGAASIIANG